ICAAPATTVSTMDRYWVVPVTFSGPDPPPRRSIQVAPFAVIVPITTPPLEMSEAPGATVTLPRMSALLVRQVTPEETVTFPSTSLLIVRVHAGTTGRAVPTS